MEDKKATKVVYTCLRVPEGRKKTLQKELEDIMKGETEAYKTNGVAQMTIKYCDHLTTAYLGGVSKDQAMKNPAAKQSLEHLGEKVQMILKKIVFNDRIAAAAIDKLDLDGKGILYENDNPHITICCKKGVKPVESNDLLSPKEGSKIPTTINLAVPIMVECEYSLN
eukprot:gnl/Chilomastix_caulleri/1174.p1 GENE.gnl/Chilomastix_caulleri/1174~~gnl/Chilomastix_caulleri/1174.p1  ORF type:complete len:167 (+),score=44.48 gnl/Chilomastix_caulleri/1174:82-582(+)